MKLITLLTTWALVTGAIVTGGGAPADAAPDPANLCRRAVPRALAGCIGRAGGASVRCYRSTGAPCPPQDPGTARALADVERIVLGRCENADAVAAAGYAPLAPAELVSRFQDACGREVESVAARSFGADGSDLAASSPGDRACRLRAAQEAKKVIARTLRQLGTCTRRTCDLDRVDAGLDAVAARSAARIAAGCADLAALVGLDPAGFAAEVQTQAQSAAASPCDPLDDTHCLYPFPNDHFSVGDPTAPTGRRVAFASEAMPVNNTGATVEPGPWNELDGFSVGPQAVFQLPDLDLAVTGTSSITDIVRSLDADAPVALIDAETGTKQLAWIERDQAATNPAQRPLMLRVGRNLPNGTRFIVALRNLKDAQGAPVAPNPIFEAYRDRVPTNVLPVEARRRHMERLFDTLAGAGIARAELALAWDFTTQSTDSTVRKLLHMRDDAFENVLGTSAPSFQVTSVDEPLDSRIFRRVNGTFQSPLYLTNGGAPGALLRRGPDGLPINQGDFVTANFRCVIPFAATTGGAAPAVPARPSLYGHGLLGSESETSAGHVRDMANEHNFIMCGTAWSGFSDDDLGTVIGVIANFSNFPQFTEHQHQGILNFMVLGRLLLHADGFASHPAFQLGGDSMIDPGALFYDGNSQGGILGGALAAVAQDIERFVLGVPGMNYSTLLHRSVDFDPFFLLLRIAYPSGFDQAVLISIAQMLWDQTDPSGHINHTTADTYPDTPPKKILYQVAFGDHQVAPVTVEVAARSNGAHIHQPALDPGKVVPELDPYYGIPAIPSYPFDGSAVVIWDSGNPAPPVGNVPPTVIGPADPEWADLSACAQDHDSDPHECPRRQVPARLQKSEFLKTGGAVIDVCGGGPCFAPNP
jgi:hypothetical protein